MGCTCALKVYLAWYHLSHDTYIQAYERVKPETHYPDTMRQDTTLCDEIRSGTVILNELHHTSST